MSLKNQEFTSVCLDCSEMMLQYPYIAINDTQKYKNKNVPNALYYHLQFHILCKQIKCKKVRSLFESGVIDQHVSLNQLVLKNTPIVRDSASESESEQYSYMGGSSAEMPGNNQLLNLISGKLVPGKEVCPQRA